jgi:enediyne biosynthesis protein E4
MKQYKNTFPVIGIFAMLLVLAACRGDEIKAVETQSADGPLFELVDNEEAGITFENTLPEETMKANIYNFNYLYNGAGIAVGDIDNDGLVDLYFVGNNVPNKLYRNLGGFRFEDITEQAGVAGGGGWHNGVQMVDINGNGRLDIYVCRGGWEEPEKDRRNLLFINNGDGTFTEKAAAFGLDDPGFSLDAAFFDFDKDGDLDMYLTNRPQTFNLGTDHIAETRQDPPNDFRDKLYRNNGDDTFTEIGREAGIMPNYGYGLSVTISDLDGNGYDDIYVANDFSESDYLYMNQGDGTFREEIKKRLPHVAFYAMGTDIADFNNDGFEDILNVEMLPEDYKRSKTSMADMKVDEYNYMLENGMHHQYMHNMLQMNHGNGHFGDVSQMTGVKTTDWSWACFLEDFDNDGHRDIFVANGYKRDVYDQDAIRKAREIIAKNKMDENFPLQELLDLFPRNEQLNYFFRNTGEFGFEKVSTKWVRDRVSLSTGAIVADLDGDGRVDLVTNNTDQPVQIYRNLGRPDHHYIRVALEGRWPNRKGLGAVVSCTAGGKTQTFQMKTSRGYLSSCEAVAHFGLGTTDKIEEVKVKWPNGRVTSVKNPSPDQLLTLKYANSWNVSETEAEKQYFSDETNIRFIDPFVHIENDFWDYTNQVLLPHRFSQNGPALAVGDVNGDGMDDFYVGGAIGQAGALYLQRQDGRFERQDMEDFERNRGYEDVVAHFIDVDGDGDLDLYVGSGGFEFPDGDEGYLDRLYINDGLGVFSRSENGLPDIRTSTGVIASGDFDGDGLPDLFVGGRVVPDKYPFPPRSYLLRNTGGGFEDVTEAWGPDLARVGMVTGAQFVDMSGEGDLDLVVAGEWMPVRIFKNRNGKLVEANRALGMPDRTGWWHALLVEDLDGDGYPDIVAGNIGNNHKFQASDEKPFHVYCDDFDDNGTWDVVLAKYAGDRKVPVRGRECSSDQMPFISDKFSTFQDYAEADLTDIISDKDLENALHYEANHFSTSIFWGNPDGYTVQDLPPICQISLVTSIVVMDVNGDGRKDLILAGNMHHTERETTRSDAGIGRVVLQGKDRSWQAESWQKSGLFLPYDVKRAKKLRLTTEGRDALLVGCNDAELRIIVR